MATIRNREDVDERIKDASHSVGDRVQLISTGEVGIIVRTWYDPFLQLQDCYVCFDDGGNRDTDPGETRPYILRYAAVSLIPIGWDGEPDEAWWETDD